MKLIRCGLLDIDKINTMLSIGSKLIIYRTYLRQMLENMVKTMEPKQQKQQQQNQECHIYIIYMYKELKEPKSTKYS